MLRVEGGTRDERVRGTSLCFTESSLILAREHFKAGNVLASSVGKAPPGVYLFDMRFFRALDSECHGVLGAVGVQAPCVLRQGWRTRGAGSPSEAFRVQLRNSTGQGVEWLEGQQRVAGAVRQRRHPPPGYGGFARSGTGS